MDTVLVTGGSGFIGTWVLRELFRQGAQPIVVDVQPGAERWRRVLGERVRDVIWAECAVMDRDRLLALIRSHRVTHVIHLAALLTPACQHDPWLGCQVNILGSVAVFDAARQSGQVRSISYASSYAVYGPESGADAESNRTTTFYGAFKQSVDLIAEQYWRHFGIASVAIRPHVVYGPERDQGLTAGPSLAARAAALGEAFHIGFTGRANYDYVEDVARAFVRAAFESPPGASTFDLIGVPATPEDFIREIDAIVPGSAARLSAGGPVLPMCIPPEPNSIAKLCPDWSTTTLREGIKQTIGFYRAPGT